MGSDVSSLRQTAVDPAGGSGCASEAGSPSAAASGRWRTHSVASPREPDRVTRGSRVEEPIRD